MEMKSSAVSGGLKMSLVWLVFRLSNAGRVLWVSAFRGGSLGSCGRLEKGDQLLCFVGSARLICPLWALAHGE